MTDNNVRQKMKLSERNNNSSEKVRHDEAMWSWWSCNSRQRRHGWRHGLGKVWRSPLTHFLFRRLGSSMPNSKTIQQSLHVRVKPLIVFFFENDTLHCMVVSIFRMHNYLLFSLRHFPEVWGFFNADIDNPSLCTG